MARRITIPEDVELDYITLGDKGHPKFAFKDLIKKVLGNHPKAMEDEGMPLYMMFVAETKDKSAGDQWSLEVDDWAKLKDWIKTANYNADMKPCLFPLFKAVYEAEKTADTKIKPATKDKDGAVEGPPSA